MIHPDHLGTPQKMTDSSGTVVWAADYKPFGEATITVSTITNNLRFPGQYYDVETGLHQNWNRDYNTSVGRYIESDPIGIDSNINHLYLYGDANPLVKIDIFGLEAEVCCRLLNNFYFGTIRRLRHCYIKNDGTTYGLYPENGIGVPRKNDPRDTGGICKPCKKKKCEDQNKCLENANNNYPIGRYSYGGPNSNTYAGTLAKSCCDGGIPDRLGWALGIGDPLPSPMFP